MMVKGLHHIALVCRDVPAAEIFYAGVLGLPCVRRQEDELGLRSVWLDLSGGVFLALERSVAEGPTRDDQAPGLHCLALGIPLESRQRTQATLTAAGQSTERETDYSFYVRDPDGVLVGLSHYPLPVPGP